MIDFTNMTVEQFMEQLSPAEFIHMAETEKVKLMDGINAFQNVAAWETAKAKRKYYQAWAGRKDDTQYSRELRADMEYWSQIWDGLKHSLNALQSTLKAEREMQRDNSGE